MGVACAVDVCPVLFDDLPEAFTAAGVTGTDTSTGVPAAREVTRSAWACGADNRPVRAGEGFLLGIWRPTTVAEPGEEVADWFDEFTPEESAHALPAPPSAIAVPIPKAIASAPTRPTYAAGWVDGRDRFLADFGNPLT